MVSWNDAAEMKLSVERLALVMPSSSASATAGLPPVHQHAAILFLEAPLLD